MSGTVKQFTFLILFIALVQQGLSQNNTNSPYSRFGIGDLEYQQGVRNLGMGGISIGIRNPGYVDLANPASFSARDTMSYVFEFSLQSKSTWLSTSDQNAGGSDINMRNLAMGFPVTKWWGASLGVMPYSTMGYLTKEIDSLAGFGTVNYQYLGEGGLSRFFIGNGFRLKNLSVGFNFSYLFGTLERNTKLTFPSDANFARTTIQNNAYVSDILLSFGLQYTAAFGKDYEFVAGGFYENETRMKTESSILRTTLLVIGNQGFTDTVSIDQGTITHMVFPRNFGAGFSLRKGTQFLFGADYYNQQWSNANFPGISDSLVNLQAFHMGIEYTPNAQSISNYLATVHYRLGARYTNTYLSLRGKQINDFGITFGLGLPLGRTKTTFNLAFQYGQRGTTEMNLIRERYGIVTFGLTLYDYWFVKRKYD